MINEKNFINEATSFLEAIFKEIKGDGIDVSSYSLDHICYRTETSDRYNELRLSLGKIGTELTEFVIKERKIATFKLKEPIIFIDRSISCIELVSPRSDMFFPEGFEHAEFVIKENFDSFMDKYSNVTFNTEALNKPVNPELIRQYKGLAVKFHHYSLEYTIKHLQ